MICSNGELGGMNNLETIYIWLWNGSLYSHLSLRGVPDVLGIHISNLVMKPKFKMSWVEWGGGGYSALFFSGP